MKPSATNRATVMAIPISTALVHVISEAGFVLTLIEVLRSVSGQVGRHYNGERREPKSLSLAMRWKFVPGAKLKASYPFRRINLSRSLLDLALQGPFARDQRSQVQGESTQD